MIKIPPPSTAVMVIPETVSQDDFTGALNGVMAHEFGHQLGFFDLYDVFSGMPQVGLFSLMDSGDGQFGTVGDPYNEGGVIAVRGILPASLDPWHKILFFPDAMNIHEAKTHLSRHLNEMSADDRIVLCNRNRPVADQTW